MVVIVAKGDLGCLCPDERFRVLVPVLDPFADVVLEGDDAAVDPAADELVGEDSEPAFDLVDPGRAGGGEVQVEAGVAGQPVADGRVLWVARLSQIRCTSRSAGTALSIATRNLRNSTARCWRCSSEMTLPSAMLNAANRLVVPWRT